ncbi:chaperone [Lithospermum erythrorhizon]|uniref:Chaperone n=1 Tax=Lithospermum erythrorhizon TaxID=34254 RepID=A0AAV3S0R7_LITER
MRAGGCAVQQTLTTEAASVLKQSLSLARRRGHAQVTPLHVSAVLLTSRISLLRRACLKSQPHQASHPLQCRALELCFNVALNRLPTTPSPLMHGQPSLSNALIAALKRAQAHQRRGCIEQQQQQPLLAIKVELEQLILSILDDPSVSRVMREAGFSSTSVKSNLELDSNSVSSVFQCYSSSGGIYSTPSSPPEGNNNINMNNNSPGSFWQSQFLNTFSSEHHHHPLLFAPQKRVFSSETGYVKEDIKLVIEVLLRKKRKNAVIVGDSLEINEGLVGELMGRVEKGDVPEELKFVHFIKFQFTAAPLRFMKKEEVEQNISDLKRKVESFVSSERGGVIVYTGDLKWTVDSSFGHEREGELVLPISEVQNHYSPVDHLVAEIGKMVSFYCNSNKRVWLIATANYQTYMKCQMKQPPLDIQWALQAVSVPSGGLGLSLNAATSVQDSRINFSHTPTQLLLGKKPLSNKEEQDVLKCCPECTTNYEKESASLKISSSSNTMDKGSNNHLPYWLKPHDAHEPEKDELVELRRKWNRLCHTLHQGKHTQNNITSVFNTQCSIGKNHHSYIPSSYPWWSNQSTILEDSKSISFADSTLQPIQKANSVPKFRRQQSCHIEFRFTNGGSKYQSSEPNLDALKNRDDKEEKITLALGSSEFSNGVDMMEPGRKRTARSAMVCKVLQDEIPWQSEKINAIVEALIDSDKNKKHRWLLLVGDDIIGKRKLAWGVAESVFGSKESLLLISTMMSNRTELLENALRKHDKLVVLVEDVDLANGEFLRYLADGFRTGNFGVLQNSCEAIFILTKMDKSTCNIDRENMKSVVQMTLMVSDMSNNVDHKRKADWELPIKSKSPRKDEMEIEFPFVIGKGKKEYSRQQSSNTLDLNIIAGEEQHIEAKHGEVIKTISIDSDQENQLSPIGFLGQIESCFNFNRNATQDDQMKETFLAKIKQSFEEVVRGNKTRIHFSVEQCVLEEMLQVSGSILDGLFEKWLKDIFETSLQRIEVCSSTENVNIRLGLAEAGKGEEKCGKDGFMGSCLPRGIQVSFLN